MTDRDREEDAGDGTRTAGTSGGGEGEVDALVALYESRTGEKRFLAERQFNSAIQALTLDMIVIGWASGKTALAPEHKLFLSLAVCLFGAVGVRYVFAKSRAYKGIKKELPVVEAALVEHCASLKSKLIKDGWGADLRSLDSLRRATRDGTNMFFVLMVLGTILAVLAVMAVPSPSAAQATSGPVATGSPSVPTPSPSR